MSRSHSSIRWYKVQLGPNKGLGSGFSVEAWIITSTLFWGAAYYGFTIRMPQIIKALPSPSNTLGNKPLQTPLQEPMWRNPNLKS